MTNISDVEIDIAGTGAKGIVAVGHALARYELEPSHGAHHAAQMYRDAVDAYTKALSETIKYLTATRDNPDARNAEDEYRLSSLWNSASSAIGPLDHSLADKCFIKGQGWLDARVWDDPRFKQYRVSIDDMRLALLEFNEKQQALRVQRAVPSWFPFVGVLFAASTILTLLYLMFGEALPQDRKFFFDAWLALSIACSAAFLGGNAAAEGKLPLMKATPLQFSAGGGIAIFMIILALTTYLYG
jgi:hypothetical protein